MVEPSLETRIDTVGPSASTIVHSLTRFLVVLRRRKSIVVISLAIAVLLGILYFATATRIYRSTASFLVLKNGLDSMAAVASVDRSMRDEMATYEQLCKSSTVLESALDELTELPPEIDRRMPRERWIQELRKMIATNTRRRTSIIDVSCRSRDAESAWNVVNSILASYVEFIDRNHRNYSEEVVANLSREQRDLQRRIRDVQNALIQAKHDGGDIGLSDNHRVVHPIVQRVVRLNEMLMESKQRRISLESSLVAIRRAAMERGDFRQHLLNLAPVVGKEILLSAIGLNRQDARQIGLIERDLVKDEAELESLSEHLGPIHPDITMLREKIRSGRQYLASFDERVERRLEGVEDPELGRMLIEIVEEDLAQTWTNERELQQQYATAYDDAVALSDRLTNVEIVSDQLNMLQDLHTAVVSRIENIDMGQNQADVRVTIINPPAYSDVPVSPVLSHVVLFFVGCGLFVGVLAVYVTDVLDDRFRSPEELQEQLGVSVLAMIPKHAPWADAGLDSLQVYVAPDSVESEAFRTLRTTLAFSGQDSSRLVITSSEPGDGKTTILANLGAAYARAGKKTLLIDGDLRRPGLSTLLNMRSASGLSDILRSGAPIGQMGMKFLRPTELQGLDILPCGQRPSDPSELLSSDRYSQLIGWAETIYDQILIDSPPALAASDAAIMGRQVDGVVLVIQPYKNHRRRVLRTDRGLSLLGVNILGIIVNAVAGEGEEKNYAYESDIGYGYQYHDDIVHQTEPTQGRRGDRVAKVDMEPRKNMSRVIPRRRAA